MNRFVLAIARSWFVVPCWLAGLSSGWAQDWSEASDQGVTPSSLGQSGYIVPGPPAEPVSASRPSGWPTDPSTATAAGGVYGHSGDSAADVASRVPVYPTTGATGPAVGPTYPQTPVSQAPPATPGEARPSPPAQSPASPWDATSQSRAALGAMEACEGAQTLAIVGGGDRCEIILMGDLLPSVNETLNQFKGRVPPAQFDMQRELLLRNRLQKHIEIKLVCLDAKEKIPEEGFAQVEKDLTKFWEEKQIPDLVRRSGVANRQELERRLTAMGTSIDREKQLFMDQAIAGEWTRTSVKPTGEITRAQMLEYYREHLAEFTHAGKVRWEQICVLIDRYPTKSEAYQAIAGMGNRVLQGQPFAEVARQHSNAPSAKNGGMNEWTTEGSLVDEELNRALFGLPIGRLSPIIEGGKAFHIVRVVEREEAGTTPFEETQKDILMRIKEERKKQATEEYQEKLRQRYPVWTAFDDRPMPSVAENPQAPRR